MVLLAINHCKTEERTEKSLLFSVLEKFSRMYRRILKILLSFIITQCCICNMLNTFATSHDKIVAKEILYLRLWSDDMFGYLRLKVSFSA